VFHGIATDIIGDFQAQGIQTNNTRAIGGGGMGGMNPMTNRSTNAGEYAGDP